LWFLDYGTEKKKYIKIEIHSTETRLTLLKNARKLNKKAIMNLRNIYLTNNVPFLVKDTRQKLLVLNEKA
jgi:hypothetical protein